MRRPSAPDPSIRELLQMQYHIANLSQFENPNTTQQQNHNRNCRFQPPTLYLLGGRCHLLRQATTNSTAKESQSSAYQEAINRNTIASIDYEI